MPKSSCQKRFTVTRAVSGFSGATSHRARPRRFLGAPGGSGFNAAGTSASTLSLGLSYSPRAKTAAIGFESGFSIWMCVTGYLRRMPSFSFSSDATPACASRKGGWRVARKYSKTSRFGSGFQSATGVPTKVRSSASCASAVTSAGARARE